MSKKKTYTASEYGNLLQAYLKISDMLDNPDGEIVRLRNHIAFMEEEAKKLHENYVWVCGRLKQYES